MLLTLQLWMAGLVGTDGTVEEVRLRVPPLATGITCGGNIITCALLATGIMSCPIGYYTTGLDADDAVGTGLGCRLPGGWGWPWVPRRL